MEGWIKIHRQIKDHWLWKSDHRLKWWLDILLTVNHADTKVLIKGNLIDCKRGQSVRSLETWAKDWNVTKKTVKEFFELLQKDSMLLYESIQISTRITVCNYDNYQTEVNAKETKGKRIVNGEETDTTPKQECKEGITTNTWRNNFDVYMSECKKGYEAFMTNTFLLQTQQRLNPGVNIKLSIEKGYVNFWGTEAGWKHKKKSKSKELDWQSTIINSISMNKVYYTKEELIKL
jgi:hypothetical protein